MEILANQGLGRRFVRWGVFALLLVTPLAASAEELDEYQVKAAFLYNFTKFVAWPATVTGVSTFTVFSICVLGDDPFGSSLDQVIKDKTAYGRPLQVRRLKDAAEARLCQIVFVRREEEAKAAKLVEAVHGWPVLTIGERHQFGRLGGMIYLTIKDNHVNVVINTAITEKANLRVSAKLMSVAKQFKEDESGDK